MYRSLGFRQGDPLSPNLVKIFVNDVSEHIDIGDSSLTLNDLTINYLLYADDIVLLAKNENDLQNLVSGLERFCKD